MQNVQFYINGYRVDRGPILSGLITTKLALEAIELQKANKDRDIIAKLQVGGFIYNMLVDNITTSPIEYLSDVTKESRVLEVFLGDRNKDISDWNSLVEEERKIQANLDTLHSAWDKIDVEDDPIKPIRSYFGSRDTKATSGYFVSGKLFKRYDISTCGDYKIGFRGGNLDVEFVLDRKLDIQIDKLYDTLESWAAYEDFAVTLRNVNADMETSGARIIATYGITDNIIRGKVEDIKYGPQFGFEWRTYIKYDVEIELAVCSRYLNDSIIEKAIAHIARELDTKIPPLTEILK